MNSRRWRVATAVVFAIGFAGCASKPPQEIGSAIADQPSVVSVQADPDAYLGEPVRWGGEIVSLSNAKSHTDVEIYARPLFDDGEPRPAGGDGVRFIARAREFLDPVEYRVGKRMTVRGTLQVPTSGLVGEFHYRYPVVAVDGMHLWPVYTPPPEPAWYGDPYWDPWWPWGPWGPYRYWPYGW